MMPLSNGWIQGIEGDLIRQPKDVTAYDLDWHHGVGRSTAGRHTRYALHKRGKGGQGYEFDRFVPRRNMFIHGFFEFFNQARGISPFISAVNPLADVYRGFDVTIARLIALLGRPCDSFVVQCLLVALKNLTTLQYGRVRLLYGHADAQDFVEHITGLEGGGSDDWNVKAIRVNPAKTTVSEFKRICTATKPGDIGFILLPEDERSEPYLENLAFRTERSFFFKDLPYTRPGDDAGREELIRRSVDRMFQQIVLRDVDGNPHGLSDIYLRYPEVLIDPVSWVVLRESVDVAQSLSDPFEINAEFEKVIGIIENGPLSRTLLKECMPPKPEQLLDVGMESLRQDDSIDLDKWMQTRWLPRALDFWLTKSWQFPYDLDNDLGSKSLIPEKRREKWEDFSLHVLRRLAEQWDVSQFKESELAQYGFDSLKAVCEFLKQPAIFKLITGTEDEIESIERKEWDGLMGVRWPHREYPFPAALNRKLKQAGRYLWIESDNMGLTHIFPSGKLLYSHLDDVADQVSQRSSWIKMRCEVLETEAADLPREWADPMRVLNDWLLNDEVSYVWHNNRSDLTKTLIGVLDNVMPVATMAQMLLAGKSVDDIVSVFEHSEKKGRLTYGKVLHRFQVCRQQTLFASVRASEKSFSASQFVALETYANYVRTDKEHVSWCYRERVINEWKQKFGAVMNGLRDQQQKELAEILGVEKLDAKTFEGAFKSLDADAKDRFVAFIDKHVASVERVGQYHGLGALFSSVTEEAMGHLEREDLRETERVYEFYKSVVSYFTSNPDMLKPNYDRQIGDEARKQQVRSAYMDEAFFQTPLDLASSALESLELLKIVLKSFCFIDGYHFLSMINTLRNVGKHNDADVDFLVIQRIFEMFCYSAEGLAAQLKLLLELAGHQNLADKIELRVIEPISLPDGVTAPSKDDMAQLVQVRQHGDGYSVYHRGVTGTASLGKFAIQLGGKVEVLEGSADSASESTEANGASEEPDGSSIEPSAMITPKVETANTVESMPSHV